MNVLIIGGGKVGYYLAQTLIEHGHDPSIIERSAASCKKLANDLDIPIICGDGTTIEALKSAGIEKMDALISVSGRDEDNLISCQLAKKIFNVPKTVARVNNPKNAPVMKKLGIDNCVSTTDNIARLIEREVDTSAIKQLVSLNMGESTIAEVNIPANYSLHGIRLSELKLPEDAIIVSINRNGRTIIPRGNAQIMSCDKILIMAKTTVLPQLRIALNMEE